jgi:hypothetical protein
MTARVVRSVQLATLLSLFVVTSVIEVDRSPVSSLFGFYVGGQKGTTVSSAFSFVF